MSVVSRYLEPALVEQLNHLQLSARSVVQGATSGAHHSPVKGASVEFRQHRFYVPGDEPRRLDWRVLGRTDRPYIKEYDEETNLRCVLMLDSSGSMAYGGGEGRWGTKLDNASQLVAALAYMMLGSTESVGLATFTERLEQWLAPHGGTPQLSRVIDLLERGVAKGRSTPQALHEVADRLERRALVVVVSDLFWPVEELRKGLAHLRHDRHEVIAIQVLDPDELTFPFLAWTRFRGLENERAMLCEPALVRKTYLENLARHRQEVEESCRMLGVEFCQYVTDRPLIEWLGVFLRRRERRRG